MTSTRTCIGCRKRAPASELARLALSRNGQVVQVVVWRTGAERPAGRGASLHTDAACLRAALKAGAFARAFRARPGSWKANEVDLMQQLTQVLSNRNKS